MTTQPSEKSLAKARELVTQDLGRWIDYYDDAEALAVRIALHLDALARREWGDWCDECDAPQWVWPNGEHDCATMTTVRGRLDALERELAEMEQRKDAAYEERNRVVAALARAALTLGHKAVRTRTAIEGWSEDWHGCVYIDLPTGQVSWHYHDSQAGLFGWLPEGEMVWDGHDTPEKYRRVEEFSRTDDPTVAELRADREQIIKTVIDLTVEQCRSDWHWGEGLDRGVLELRVRRAIDAARARGGE